MISTDFLNGISRGYIKRV